MRLYVGNLSFETTENDLQDAFERFGSVTDVKVMMDHGTGRSRGFGFVTMGTAAEGTAAITGLEGQDLGGGTVTVNEARPREERAAAAVATSVARSARTPVHVATKKEQSS